MVGYKSTTTAKVRWGVTWEAHQSGSATLSFYWSYPSLSCIGSYLYISMWAPFFWLFMLRPKPFRYSHAAVVIGSQMIVSHGYYYDQDSFSAVWLADTWAMSLDPPYSWQKLHGAGKPGIFCLSFERTSFWQSPLTFNFSSCSSDALYVIICVTSCRCSPTPLYLLVLKFDLVATKTLPKTSFVACLAKILHSSNPRLSQSLFLSCKSQNDKNTLSSWLPKPITAIQSAIQLLCLWRWRNLKAEFLGPPSPGHQFEAALWTIWDECCCFWWRHVHVWRNRYGRRLLLRKRDSGYVSGGPSNSRVPWYKYI